MNKHAKKPNHDENMNSRYISTFLYEQTCKETKPKQLSYHFTYVSIVFAQRINLLSDPTSCYKYPLWVVSPEAKSVLYNTYCMLKQLTLSILMEKIAQCKDEKQKSTVPVLSRISEPNRFVDSSFTNRFYIKTT